MPETVHVVFHPDAVDDLREAVRRSGRLDRVTVFRDDLRFGPISPLDQDQREEWVRRRLHRGAWYEEEVGDTAPFWDEALQPGKRLVAWTSRRSGREYAGFLEWLRRLADRPCEVVDLTETMVAGIERDGSAPPPRPAVSLAYLPPETILALGLLDAARPLDAVSRQRHRRLWDRLRAENAPLRLFDAGLLQSTEITALDAALLAAIVSDWRKVARVAAEVFAARDEDYDEVSLFFLSARLRALVKAGRIESQGDIFRPRYGEVRRARDTAAAEPMRPPG